MKKNLFFLCVFLIFSNLFAQNRTDLRADLITSADYLVTYLNVKFSDENTEPHTEPRTEPHFEDNLGHNVWKTPRYISFLIDAYLETGDVGYMQSARGFISELLDYRDSVRNKEDYTGTSRPLWRIVRGNFEGSSKSLQSFEYSSLTDNNNETSDGDKAYYSYHSPLSQALILYPIAYFNYIVKLDPRNDSLPTIFSQYLSIFAQAVEDAISDMRNRTWGDCNSDPSPDCVSVSKEGYFGSLTIERDYGDNILFQQYSDDYDIRFVVELQDRYQKISNGSWGGDGVSGISTAWYHSNDNDYGYLATVVPYNQQLILATVFLYHYKYLKIAGSAAADSTYKPYVDGFAEYFKDVLISQTYERYVIDPNGLATSICPAQIDYNCLAENYFYWHYKRFLFDPLDGEISWMNDIPHMMVDLEMTAKYYSLQYSDGIIEEEDMVKLANTVMDKMIEYDENSIPINYYKKPDYLPETIGLNKIEAAYVPYILPYSIFREVSNSGSDMYELLSGIWDGWENYEDGLGNTNKDGEDYYRSMIFTTNREKLLKYIPFSENGASFSYGGYDFNGITSGDFNCDGRDDIAFYRRNSSATTTKNLVKIYISTTSGFSAWVSYSYGNQDFYDITSGDYDNDSCDDIAVITKYDSSVVNHIAVSWGGSTGMTPGSTITYGGRSFKGVTSGDFNGDGKDDIAVYRRNWGDDLTENLVKVFNSNGRNGLVAGQSFSWGGMSFYDITSSDYNNDGIDDIAVLRRYDSNSPINYVKVFLGTTGAFSMTGPSFKYGNDDFEGMASGDYNMDGVADLALYKDSHPWSGVSNPNYILVFYSNRLSFEPANAISWGGYSFEGIASGNFNNDTYQGNKGDDIAVFRRNSSAVTTKNLIKTFLSGNEPMNY